MFRSKPEGDPQRVPSRWRTTLVSKPSQRKQVAGAHASVARDQETSRIGQVGEVMAATGASR
jgi:RNase P/RNase MRP subunit p29